MKKTILSFLTLCAFAGNAFADETLQVLPQQIVAGSLAGDYENSFSIEMVNDDNVYTAMQFDLYLPEGVDIDDYGIELNPDRFPNKVVKKQIVFEHEVKYAKRAEGFYRISITGANGNPSIGGTGGPICDVYYTSAGNLPASIMPVRIEGIVLAVSGTQGVKPSANTSFLYTEDCDFGALTSLDLAAAEGVTVKGVASAARSLMANPNSLLYLNEGSEAEGLDNVVIGNTCERLVLEDAYAFNAPKPFTAASASYTRTLEKDGWYSLCLPFAATVLGGSAADAKVERFDYVDTDNAVIYFKEGTVAADKPCIFSAKAGTAEFSAEDAEVAATPESLGDGDFVGTYSLLPAGSITGSYALYPDGRGFGTATETAYTEPFRAIVKTAAKARMLVLRHGDIATAIDSPEAEGTRLNAEDRYNIAGQRVTNNYKGVVIKGGKKTIQ